MDNVETVIIGAGVVGLAIARALSCRGLEVVVVERHDAFGRETSSRNSEVIHAGFYYPPQSLKARLCVEGNRLLYDFCAANGVQHRKCGKLVVARNHDEENKIRRLFDQGMANGVSGLELCAPDRIQSLEPAISGTLGLWSPTTGIFDTHAFMKRLEQQSLEAGATIAYHCELSGIMKSAGGYVVSVIDADGSLMTLATQRVINAAGLSADGIAAMAGIDVDAAGYQIRYCKGEYFSVSSRHKNRLHHLVYPAPTPISLGVHAVLGLEGTLRLGPNAFFVDTIDYDVDPSHCLDFYADAKTLLPFLDESDLTPDMSGIRPKLVRDNGSFPDFIIRDEASRGLPGLINLIGIESPGLTSSLAIARYVESIIDGTVTALSQGDFPGDATD
ncbi:MAG: NAD(P)/FAD-dependent oxidoreductase [Chitinispirillaceae bacterium]|nr:NAD(P)/FAD-dependent oxidoreductase [Chitinispirillaceae bacterium]